MYSYTFHSLPGLCKIRRREQSLKERVEHIRRAVGTCLRHALETPGNHWAYLNFDEFIHVYKSAFPKVCHLQTQADLGPLLPPAVNSFRHTVNEMWTYCHVPGAGYINYKTLIRFGKEFIRQKERDH
jgi:hypothetical protein